MKTDMAIKLIQKWSFDYIKMDCAGEKCYGVLAVRELFSAPTTINFSFLQVHRICFALSLFHLILSSALVGIQDTRDKRAAIQNG